ncbi:MAG TPA: A24 family peptidase C-terminal domain-containing protein [Methanobacteriaceae archaeon]|nr:A24 family peptidase C-terminal domain-containing protein [Methanobacteriaceae archaeon]
MIQMFLPIPLLATIIAILASVYASYTDITKGIIPNRLTFPLIGVGMVLNGIYAILIGDLWYLILGLIITGVIFGLGYIFWKMGAWAGGDVKLFTALAALLPFYPAVVSYQVFSHTFPMEAAYPFPLTVIINSILSMLPFLLIYVLFVAMRTKPHLLGELLSPIKEWQKNLVTTLLITSAVTISVLVVQVINYPNLILYLILIYLLVFLISKLPKYVKAGLIAVAVFYSFYTYFQVTLMGIITLLLTLIAIGMVRKLLTSVSREALQDDYPVEGLEEGMILAYKLYQTNGEVEWDEKGFFTKIKETFAKKDLTLISRPPGKLVISSLAAGLTKDDIKLLKKLRKEGKIKEEVRIKRGVPFAPSILIGLLLSLFIGDLAFIIQQLLFNVLY